MNGNTEDLHRATSASFFGATSIGPQRKGYCCDLVLRHREADAMAKESIRAETLSALITDYLEEANFGRFQLGFGGKKNVGSWKGHPERGPGGAGKALAIGSSWVPKAAEEDRGGWWERVAWCVLTSSHGAPSCEERHGKARRKVAAAAMTLRFCSHVAADAAATTCRRPR
ncbi:hypothetical protein KM043_016427 [Ampulex compressa]|nr:hypothetical protein KM043_016427 [Ampulex compressa]